MKKAYIFICVLICLGFSAWGQVAFVPIQGLPNQHILDIAQDESGYIWIATGHGLSRYNGYEYKNYFHVPGDETSIPSDLIFKTCVDRNGVLWVATWEGVARYNEESDVFVTEALMQDRSMSGFLELEDKFLVYGDGLCARFANAEEFVSCPLPSEAYFIHALQYPDGRIALFNGEKPEVYYLDANLSYLGKEALSAIVSSSASIDGGEVLLLGTEKGLQMEKGNWTDVPQIGAAVQFICEYKQYVLIGTDAKGVLEYVKTEKGLSLVDRPIFFPDCPSKNVVACFPDKENNLWLGTFDSGYYNYFVSQSVFNFNPTFSGYLQGKLVTRIAADSQHCLWIGTREDGLYYYNPSYPRITHYWGGQLDPGAGEFVQSLLVDSKNRLWLGLGTRLLCFQIAKNGSIKKLFGKELSTDVVTLFEDSRGRVFIGTSSRSMAVVDSRGDFRWLLSDDDRSRNVTFITESASGEILFSVYGEGIRVMDPFTYAYAPLAESMPTELTRTIFLLDDLAGNLWVGTYGKGLIRYDRANGTLRQYTMLDGLPSNDILAILPEENGEMWMSTVYGLSRFNQEHDKFVNYYVFDKIGGNQFYEKACARNGDGVLFFGGNHGLTYFRPSQIMEGKKPGPVLVEDIKVMNHSLKLGDGILMSADRSAPEITLSHPQNIFNVDYAALNYGQSQRTRYAYRLNGFDSDWVMVGNTRRATYSNLDRGTYTLEICTVDDYGALNLPPTVLTINVKGNPWTSPTAIFCYSLLLLSGLVMLLFWSSRYKMQKLVAANAVREMEQEKELSEMKVRFFTNISHELNTPLSLIYAPVYMLLDDPSVPEDPRRKLEVVIRNVERLRILVSEFMDLEDVNSDTLSLSIALTDVSSLIRGLEADFSYSSPGKNLTITTSVPDTPVYAYVDAEKIYKILSNLMMNAVKYTLRDGHIHLSLSQTDALADDRFGLLQGKPCLVFAVSDDGMGMPADQVKDLFLRHRRFETRDRNRPEASGTGIGLNYVNSLVRVHKGEITAALGEEKGMVFTVVIPTDPSLYPPEDFAPNASPITTHSRSSYVPKPMLDTNPEVDNQLDKSILLIVEDSYELTVILRSLLEPEFTIVTAYDGRNGLEKSIQFIPDIILSDVMMPFMDGFEFCHRVKTDMRLSHIPVVFLSARNRDDDHQKGYEEGADFYIDKPFNPQLLKSFLVNLKRQISRRGTTSGEGVQAPVPATQLEQEVALPPLNKMDKRFLDKLNSYLEEHLSDSDLQVQALGAELGFSRTSFYRKIKALTGKTPNDFLLTWKLDRAARLLLSKDFSVSEVCDMTGFKTHAHFSTVFKKRFGVSPKDYNGEPPLAESILDADE